MQRNYLTRGEKIKPKAMIIEYAVTANASIIGNGWTAFRYVRPNDNKALDFAWGEITNDLDWDDLVVEFRNMERTIKMADIKSKVDIDLINGNRIWVCRQGKILPSIWIVREG